MHSKIQVNSWSTSFAICIVLVIQLLFAFRDLWKEWGVETFNVLDIYPSEHYGLSFFGPYGCLFFTRSPFFVYISILQVHFACVLCI